MANFVCLTDKGSLISSATPEAFALYESEGRGPVTSNGGEGGAFVRTRDGLHAPDVQFHIGCLLLHEEFLGVPFDDAYTFGPAVVKPTSRGQVTLRSPIAACPAAHPAQLPADRGGPPEHDRGGAAEHGNQRGPGAARVAAGRLPRAEVRLRGRHHGLRAAPRAHAVPPGRHVRDGLGGRRRVPRPRPGGPARGRRLGDADDPAREHQRADDHGGREGGGHDPRTGSPAARADPRTRSPPDGGGQVRRQIATANRSQFGKRVVFGGLVRCAWTSQPLATG